MPTLSEQFREFLQADAQQDNIALSKATNISYVMNQYMGLTRF